MRSRIVVIEAAKVPAGLSVLQLAIDRILTERPLMLRGIRLKKVVLRDDRYWLYFMEKRFRPMILTASMVRTLADAFGDDCDDWKGRPVTFVEYRAGLLVREEDFTTYVDEDEPQRKGKRVLSVVPLAAILVT
jgi:hypothetical protein